MRYPLMPYVLYYMPYILFLAVLPFFINFHYLYIFFSFPVSSKCKQKDVQNQCEARMVLLWEENGERTFIVYQDICHWCKRTQNILICLFLLIHLQDTADMEWMMWFSTFREHILFALSGHVLFAKICSMLAPQVLLLSDSLINNYLSCSRR